MSLQQMTIDVDTKDLTIIERIALEMGISQTEIISEAIHRTALLLGGTNH